MLKRLYLLCVGALLCLSVPMMGFGERVTTVNQIIVEVSIPPMVEWVKAVGGQYVQVSPLLNDYQYPDTDTITDDILQRFSDVNIFFTLGTLPFEQDDVMATIKRRYRGVRVFSLTESPEARKLILENEGVVLQNIWMSPSRVIAFVKEIQEYLSKYDPEHAMYYSQRATEYLVKLSDLEVYYDDTFKLLAKRSVITYYPFLDYLAHDYGFYQVAFKIDKLKNVPASSILDAIEKTNVRSIIFTYQFGMQKAAELAEDFDGNIVFVNPLDPNYISNMMDVARLITLHF